LLPQKLQCWENAFAFSQCWYYIYVVSHSAVQLEFFRLRPVDEERRKNSEETRSITNAGERDDYVSDRGWRGSSPTWGAKKIHTLLSVYFFVCVL